MWKLLHVPSRKLSFQLYRKWRFALQHVQLKQGMYEQNLKQESLQLGKSWGRNPQPKPCLPLNQLYGGKGCAERLRDLCPWRFSGSDLTKPWAAWSDPAWSKKLRPPESLLTWIILQFYIKEEIAAKPRLAKPFSGFVLFNLPCLFSWVSRLPNHDLLLQMN